MAATGNEIATLSNVSAAMGLSKNTLVATGNELVTLSNLNAILDAQSSSSGKPSFIGKTWAEISQMSKEIDTLGVGAFREKYLPYLGALATFPWAGYIGSSNNVYPRDRRYGLAMLIGIGQDTDTSGKTAGFTFIILSSPTANNIYDSSVSYHNSFQNSYMYDYISNNTAYTVGNLGSSFKPYVRTIKRKGGWDVNTSNLKIWVLSAAEIGATQPSDSDNALYDITDSKAVYDVFSDSNTDYFSRNILQWMINDLAENNSMYSINGIFTSTIGKLSNGRGRGITVSINTDTNASVDPTAAPCGYKYFAYQAFGYNAGWLVPMGFCV